MSDMIETLKSMKSQAFFAGRAGVSLITSAERTHEALENAIAEIERLRAELAEHERRAALVATWAEGLRSGKRYSFGNPEVYFYFAYRDDDMGMEAYFVRGTGSLEHEVSPARAAAYMLAVSENWREVGA